MLVYVLGAPGSGKSTVAPILRRLLPGFVVLDWDDFMSAASELAGGDVRRTPSLWPSYRRLVRAVVDTIDPSPLVVLGVCTPDELDGWPTDAWMLLDCSDEERQQRLRGKVGSLEVDDALADAARYRELDLSVIDTTDRPPQSVAAELAGAIQQLDAQHA